MSCGTLAGAGEHNTANNYIYVNNSTDEYGSGNTGMLGKDINVFYAIHGIVHLLDYWNNGCHPGEKEPNSVMQSPYILSNIYEVDKVKALGLLKYDLTWINNNSSLEKNKQIGYTKNSSLFYFSSTWNPHLKNGFNGIKTFFRDIFDKLYNLGNSSERRYKQHSDGTFQP